MTLESLLANINFLKLKDPSNLIEELKSNVKSLRVKEFKKGDERPCENSDFEAEKKHRENYLKILKLILEDFVNNGFLNQDPINRAYNENKRNHVNMGNELIAFILIICGENSCLKPWNTEGSVKICSEILTIILKHFDCTEISEFIEKDCNRNIVKEIFHIICPNLLANTWKNFPATFLFYQWFLKAIKQPKISSNLSLILPIALLLVDDFVPENKMNGVKCLHHIIENMTIAELQFHGHGDVIYSALMPLLRLREADLISLTIPCLLAITIKLETDFGKKQITQWSKFDNILEIVLENMNMEQSLELRFAYIKNLEPLLNASESGNIRWSKRLLKIFKEYSFIGIKHKDEITINCCLKAIQSFIKTSEPVLKFCAKNLLFTLLMVLHNINDQNSTDICKKNQEITIKLLHIILKFFSERDKEIFKKELKGKLETHNFSSFYEDFSVFFEKFDINKSI